ncbi:hypothetical protein D3C81_1380820 [compost metagenome]
MSFTRLIFVGNRHTIKIEEFRPVVEVPARPAGRVVLTCREHFGIDTGGCCLFSGNCPDCIVITIFVAVTLYRLRLCQTGTGAVSRTGRLTVRQLRRTVRDTRITLPRFLSSRIKAFRSRGDRIGTGDIRSGEQRNRQGGTAALLCQLVCRRAFHPQTAVEAGQSRTVGATVGSGTILVRVADEDHIGLHARVFGIQRRGKSRVFRRISFAIGERRRRTSTGK